MRKALFALPVLLMALVFAFCTKSSVKEELSATPETAVSGRANCTVEVFADNLQTLEICGTNSNQDKCTNCAGNSTAGVEYVIGHGFVTITSPGDFYITNLGANGVWVRLSTGVSSTGWTFIAASGCQTYSLDGTCNF